MAKQKEIPESVVDLIDYLKSTGTGQAKLDALVKLAKKCDSGEQFLAKAPKVVPEGTMAKIVKYVTEGKGSQEGDLKLPPTKKPSPFEDEREVTISPVAESKAEEAIAAISSSNDKKFLHQVLDLDPRVTVKKAAEERLGVLAERAGEGEDEDEE